MITFASNVITNLVKIAIYQVWIRVFELSVRADSSVTAWNNYFFLVYKHLNNMAVIITFTFI